MTNKTLTFPEFILKIVEKTPKLRAVELDENTGIPKSEAYLVFFQNQYEKYLKKQASGISAGQQRQNALTLDAIKSHIDTALERLKGQSYFPQRIIIEISKLASISDFSDKNKSDIISAFAEKGIPTVERFGKLYFVDSIFDDEFISDDRSSALKEVIDTAARFDEDSTSRRDFEQNIRKRLAEKSEIAKEFLEGRPYPSLIYVGIHAEYSPLIVRAFFKLFTRRSQYAIDFDSENLRTVIQRYTFSPEEANETSKKLITKEHCKLLPAKYVYQMAAILNANKSFFSKTDMLAVASSYHNVAVASCEANGVLPPSDNEATYTPLAGVTKLKFAQELIYCFEIALHLLSSKGPLYKLGLSEDDDPQKSGVSYYELLKIFDLTNLIPTDQNIVEDMFGSLEKEAKKEAIHRYKLLTYSQLYSPLFPPFPQFGLLDLTDPKNPERVSLYRQKRLENLELEDFKQNPLNGTFDQFIIEQYLENDPQNLGVFEDRFSLKLQTVGKLRNFLQGPFSQDDLSLTQAAKSFLAGFGKFTDDVDENKPAKGFHCSGLDIAEISTLMMPNFAISSKHQMDLIKTYYLAYSTMPLNLRLLNRSSYWTKVLGVKGANPVAQLPFGIRDRFEDKLIEIAMSDSDLRNFDVEERLKLFLSVAQKEQENDFFLRVRDDQIQFQGTSNRRKSNTVGKLGQREDFWKIFTPLFVDSKVRSNITLRGLFSPVNAGKVIFAYNFDAFEDDYRSGQPKRNGKRWQESINQNAFSMLLETPQNLDGLIRYGFLRQLKILDQAPKQDNIDPEMRLPTDSKEWNYCELDVTRVHPKRVMDLAKQFGINLLYNLFYIDADGPSLQYLGMLAALGLDWEAVQETFEVDDLSAKQREDEAEQLWLNVLKNPEKLQIVNGIYQQIQISQSVLVKEFFLSIDPEDQKEKGNRDWLRDYKKWIAWMKFAVTPPFDFGIGRAVNSEFELDMGLSGGFFKVIETQTQKGTDFLIGMAIQEVKDGQLRPFIDEKYLQIHYNRPTSKLTKMERLDRKKPEPTGQQKEPLIFSKHRLSLDGREVDFATVKPANLNAWANQLEKEGYFLQSIALRMIYLLDPDFKSCVKYQAFSRANSIPEIDNDVFRNQTIEANKLVKQKFIDSLVVADGELKPKFFKYVEGKDLAQVAVNEAVSAEIIEANGGLQLMGETGEIPKGVKQFRLSVSPDYSAGSTKNIDMFMEIWVQPFNYQKVGIGFANELNFRCIIGDDMGLGKTLQAIASLALCMQKFPQHTFPVAVICPASVIGSWAGKPKEGVNGEIQRWIPEFEGNVLIVDGSVRRSPDFLENLRKFPIHVYGYESFRETYKKLIDDGQEDVFLRYNMLIMDEMHRAKNRKAGIGAAILRFNMTKRAQILERDGQITPKNDLKMIGLTGTLLENRLPELYVPFHLFLPDRFPNYQQFMLKMGYTIREDDEDFLVVPFQNPASHSFYAKATLECVQIRRFKGQALRGDLPSKRRVYNYINLPFEAMKEYYRAVSFIPALQFNSRTRRAAEYYKLIYRKFRAKDTTGQKTKNGTWINVFNYVTGMEPNIKTPENQEILAFDELIRIMALLSKQYDLGVSPQKIELVQKMSVLKKLLDAPKFGPLDNKQIKLLSNARGATALTYLHRILGAHKSILAVEWIRNFFISQKQTVGLPIPPKYLTFLTALSDFKIGEYRKRMIHSDFREIAINGFDYQGYIQDLYNSSGLIDYWIDQCSTSHINEIYEKLFAVSKIQRKSMQTNLRKNGLLKESGTKSSPIDQVIQELSESEWGREFAGGFKRDLQINERAYDPSELRDYLQDRLKAVLQVTRVTDFLLRSSELERIILSVPYIENATLDHKKRCLEIFISSLMNSLLNKYLTHQRMKSEISTQSIQTPIERLAKKLEVQATDTGGVLEGYELLRTIKGDPLTNVLSLFRDPNPESIANIRSKSPLSLVGSRFSLFLIRFFQLTEEKVIDALKKFERIDKFSGVKMSIQKRRRIALYDDDVTRDQLKKRSIIPFRVEFAVPDDRKQRMFRNTFKAFQTRFYLAETSLDIGEENLVFDFANRAQNKGNQETSNKWFVDEEVLYAYQLVRRSKQPLVVFCKYIPVFENIIRGMEESNITYTEIRGNVPASKRGERVKAFQDGRIQVFLANQSAREGITLTEASNELFVELWYVPARIDQAEDRIWRIGQKSDCTIHYLVARNTIDTTRLLPILKRKRLLTALVAGAEKIGESIEATRAGGYSKDVKEDIFADLESEIKEGSKKLGADFKSQLFDAETLIGKTMDLAMLAKELGLPENQFQIWASKKPRNMSRDAYIDSQLDSILLEVQFIVQVVTSRSAPDIVAFTELFRNWYDQYFEQLSNFDDEDLFTELFPELGDISLIEANVRVVKSDTLEAVDKITETHFKLSESKKPASEMTAKQIEESKFPLFSTSYKIDKDKKTEKIILFANSVRPQLRNHFLESLSKSDLADQYCNLAIRLQQLSDKTLPLPDDENWQAPIEKALNINEEELDGAFAQMRIQAFIDYFSSESPHFDDIGRLVQVFDVDQSSFADEIFGKIDTVIEMLSKSPLVKEVPIVSIGDNTVTYRGDGLKYLFEQIVLFDGDGSNFRMPNDNLKQGLSQGILIQFSEFVQKCLFQFGFTDAGRVGIKRGAKKYR